MTDFRSLYRAVWRPIRRQYSLFRQRMAARAAAEQMFQKALDGNLIDDLPKGEKQVWSERIRLVMADRHNKLIPRHKNAGQKHKRGLVMHNGLLVSPLSYYNKPMLQMLVANRGVHEPEEEFIFSAVLRFLSPTATMLELGSYWAFYSMCFLNGFPKRTALMVEPEAENLASGVTNFELNGFKGTFVQAGVGARTSSGNPRVISIDEFLHSQGIQNLDVLHCDIQGYELEMLEGAFRFLSEQRASCIFISTHSNELHTNCKERLLSFGYIVLRDTDLDHTSSYDGLLFACSPTFFNNTAIRSVIANE